MDVRGEAHVDHARSIAILIGVADAVDGADGELLRAAPATLTSLRAMNRLLTDPDLGGWPTDRVTVLRNPDNPAATTRRLRELTRAARDLLVVYYVGRARLTSRGQLCLALASSDPGGNDSATIGYEWVARAVRDSPARRKVAILDCCVPGGDALGRNGEGLADLAHVEGVYTLTAAARSHPTQPTALMHQRPPPTSFTGQLVELVENGVVGGPAGLTLADIHARLQERLVGMGLPPPAQRGGDAVGTLPAFARNVAHRPAPAGSAGSAAAGPAAPPDATVAPPERASVLTPLLAGLGTLGSKGLAAATEATTPRRHARDEAVARANASPPPAPPPLDVVEAPDGQAVSDLVGAAALATVAATTASPTAEASATGGSGGGSSGTGSGSSSRGLGGSGAGAGSNGTPPNGKAKAKGRGHDKAGRDDRSASSGDADPDVTEPMTIAESKASGPAPPSSSVHPPPPPPPDEAKPAPAAAGPLSAGSPPPPPLIPKPLPKPGPGPAAPAPLGDAPRNRRSRRRVLVPAVALTAAVLVPAIYFVEASNGHDTTTADQSSSGVVDLSEVGTRTVNLGTGIDPWSLVDDGDTLWVQSGQRGNAQLHQVDLTTGEVVASVPLRDAGVVGAAVIGDGSLWVSTGSVETLKGAVMRIDPSSGEVLATIELPVWPGRMVFAGGSLWVATVQQPVVEELGARDDAFSSAANGIDRIDPRTDTVVATIPLDAKPVDVQAAGDDILVSTEGAESAALVVVDPMAERQQAVLPVPDSIGTDADPQAHGPWMLFASDPYAVRFDVEAEDVAAVAGSGEGIDMVVPNGEHLWEMRGRELTILGLRGDPIATVTIDGLPIAAAAAGEGAAWIAYRPSDSSNVIVTRVTAATLIERSGPLATP